MGFQVTEASSSPLRSISVAAFTVCMAVMFLVQTAFSIDKLRSKQIVEEVSHDQTTFHETIPPVTVCRISGYKPGFNVSSYTDVPDFEELCGRNANITACLEKYFYDTDDIVHSVVRGTSPSNITFMPHSSVILPTSTNLAAGKCFTMQSKVESPGSLIVSDSIMLSSEGWSEGALFFLTVHDELPIMPMTGMMGGNYGRHFITFVPEERLILQITASIIERRNKNTKANPCEENDSYSLTRCVEEYIAGHVGCSSPWDAFPKQGVRQCSSMDDFASLWQIHKELNDMSPLWFRGTTKCIPRCNYRDFEVVHRTFLNTEAMRLRPRNISTDAASITIGIYTSEKKLIRQTLLFDTNSFISELGGSLGMFLGASMITLFHFLLYSALKVSRIVSGSKP